MKKLLKYFFQRKNLRDELAMSLSSNSIPTLLDEDTMVLVAKEHNINFDFEDPLSLINFAIQYESIIRYKYADAMLKERNGNI